MCRMVCATGTYDPSFLSQALKHMAQGNNIDHELHKKIPGLQHTDGWGVAQWSGSGWSYTKSTTSVLEDNSFDAIAQTPAKATILHARHRTVGGVAEENTHPFFDEDRGIVFFHNGHVKDSLTIQRTPLGETDSERLFLRYLDLLDQGRTEAGALKQLVLELNDYWGANLVVGTPQKMYVVVAHKLFPKYYSMRTAIHNKGFLALSEPVGNAPLQTAQNRSVYEIDLFSSAVNTQHI